MRVVHQQLQLILLRQGQFRLAAAVAGHTAQESDEVQHALAFDHLRGTQVVLGGDGLHHGRGRRVVAVVQVGDGLRIACGGGAQLLPGVAQAVRGVVDGIPLVMGQQFVGVVRHARVVAAQLFQQGGAVGAHIPTGGDLCQHVPRQGVQAIELQPLQKAVRLGGIGVGHADLGDDGRWQHAIIGHGLQGLLR